MKVGGSLAHGDATALRGMLRHLVEDASGPVVIVPGGGPFADAVRMAQSTLGFDDLCAHRMALRAMDQYGLLLCSLEPRLTSFVQVEALPAVLDRSAAAVWFPAAVCECATDIEACWDVTSDSIAAWLAHRFDATRLTLVKSCALPDPMPDHATLARLGIVDPAFPRYAARARCSIAIVHAGDLVHLPGESRRPPSGRRMPRRPQR